MRVLMFGWEYPPHISGGLGTACQGLTTALGAVGVQIDFVVPRLFGGEDAPHMRLLGIDSPPSTLPNVAPPEPDVAAPPDEPAAAEPAAAEPAPVVEIVSDVSLSVRVEALDSPLSPYLDAQTYSRLVEALAEQARTALRSAGERAWLEGAPSVAGSAAGAEPARAAAAHYGTDLMTEVRRYAERAGVLASAEHDLIHAHDWMTYLAGIEAKRRSGKPLVLHVHSLEYDRSGDGGGNPDIIDIERRGLTEADLVIAVSHYTRTLVNRIHGVPLERIAVVHNGVYKRQTVEAYRRERKRSGPVVLFLGRVTFQKGPEYFVEAAAKVVPHVPDVCFVMAGSGDLLPRMQERVKELGIEAHFEFPGFLKGKQVEEAFSVADVYVMPSVSEPFGISALEAMSYNRPVIISRQSGVAELLDHALKVDFWDTDLLASKIVSLLVYPELRAAIVESARDEVKKLHWEAAGEKTLSAYRTLLNGAPSAEDDVTIPTETPRAQPRAGVPQAEEA